MEGEVIEAMWEGYESNAGENINSEGEW
jgi:hypothetical protein